MVVSMNMRLLLSSMYIVKSKIYHYKKKESNIKVHTITVQILSN